MDETRRDFRGNKHLSGSRASEVARLYRRAIGKYIDSRVTRLFHPLNNRSMLIMPCATNYNPPPIVRCLNDNEVDARQ